ncbi:hypothetical protein BKG82_26395 [Mycobacteroides chelonae]|uniref:Transcriptional regulator n=1 Tax=Mycobacteroides chelonae TaxID=1774 RepID=A0A1S1LCP4_MYCCH|nr:hypothetical protein [Mycobacteroides chelonae]OHU47188.1 hypothetical protein BKG82_26395 [Mycobacteroides chelonae]
MYAHAQLGSSMLRDCPRGQQRIVSAASAEAWLLAGRIAAFDLEQRVPAQDAFNHALECAGAAKEHQLAAAVLAYLALLDGSRDYSKGSETIRMARAFARRGEGCLLLNLWLDAVDAEILTRRDDIQGALQLIASAEANYREDLPRPAWLDWFTQSRLPVLRASALLTGGRSGQARVVLERALHDLPLQEVRQRATILADLAAISIAERDPATACKLLGSALQELKADSNPNSVRRIRAVRAELTEWETMKAVRALDDRLYDWATTLGAVS